MKVVGHCRFSYFGLTDTGRAIMTEEDAHRLLWNEPRMASRFHLFENLLLPSLRAQTDPDFTLYILTSEAMPEIYHRRLAAITADLPQIVILRTEKTDPNRFLKDVIFEAHDQGTVPSVQFRIDDDDALSHDYVSRLRAAADRLPYRTLISFPSGVLAFSDGASSRCCPQHKAWIAIGLATVNAPDDLVHPFRMQHRKAHLKRPSFMDPNFCAYIHTLHNTNNTSGYDTPPAFSGADRRAINRAKTNWPELETKRSTDGLADVVASAFPFLTVTRLNTILSRKVLTLPKTLPKAPAKAPAKARAAAR